MKPASLVLGGGILAASLLLPSSGVSAPPGIPQTISYQGVLLDSAGDPRTGPVDLTVRIYDGLSGGVLVYKQDFTAVPLTDGVFAIRIGATGAATDSPTNPLTTSLAGVFIADLPAAGANRFLELTVGSEGALGRIQVLSAPFALHSETADVAETAVNAANVNGLDALFVTELFEHTNSDGSGPPNTDPAEGLGDTDGDAIANFVDTDNDNDTIGDSTEVSQGSDINLVTPIVGPYTPSTAFGPGTTPVIVSGQNYQPGLTVQFGTQSPAPQNVTPTSFQVAVGPQTLGSASVSVTLPNAEFDAGPNFTFVNNTSHSVQLGSVHHATLSVLGTGQTLLGGGGEYGVDTNLDGAPDLDVLFLGPFGGFTFPSQLAVTWNPAGRVAGVFCRGVSSTACDIEYRVDADADFLLEGGETAVIETVSGLEPRLWSPSLVFDPSGHAVVGYATVAGQSTVYAVKVARDGNGDGQWSPSERVLVESALARPMAGKLALDPAGRVAYAYGVLSNAVRVAYDRSGDGDFNDAPGGNPELFTVATSLGSVDCAGVAFDSGGRLAVVYGGPSDKVTLFRDLDVDGAVDGGETSVLESGVGGAGCDVARSGTGPLAVAYREHTPNSLVLRIDRDGNGDFTGANETLTLLPPIGSDADRVAVTLNAAGVVFVADGTSTTGRIFVDPEF